MMKKIVLISILLCILFSSAPSVFAGDSDGSSGKQKHAGTILPTVEGETNCKEVLDKVFSKADSAEAAGEEGMNKVLGCAVKTGRIELWMVPHFIMYVIEGLLAIAGLISVLFIVIGGYQYTVGGLTEEKDKAKKTIMYAIAGLVVALLAWALVNLIQLALTG